MPYCPDCGAETDPDNVYCSNCGRDLGGDPQDDSDWGTSDDEWATSDSGDSWDEYSSGEQPDNPPDQPGQGRGAQGGGGRGRGGQGGGWEGGQGRSGGQQASGWGDSQRGEWGEGDGPPQDELYIEDGKVDYAIKLPYSDGWGAIAISALCYLGAFLLIPFFIIEGYLYRVTEAAAWGDTIQPRFDDYGGMIKSGFLYFVLYLLYFLGGAVVIGGLAFAGIEGGVPGVAALIAVVLGLAWLYVGPAVLTLYPVTGSFGTALSPSRIAEFAFTGKYAVSFLIYIALYFAVSFALNIVFFILAITVIGLLLAIPLTLAVGPYLLYLTGAYWGATYYEAAQEGIVTPPWEEDAHQQEPYQSEDPAGASEW